MAATKGKAPFRKVEDWVEDRIVAIWMNLQNDHLWQRMLKVIVATTITVILGLIPAVVAVYGRAIYLAPITTVFGHPGRRFGMMAEALVLAVMGTSVGVAWSTLGIYLSSLIYDTNSAAAYTIKGVFLVIALLFHGVLRSHTPRLFIFVLLLVIVSVVSLTGTSKVVSSALVTGLLYPILTAVGILLLVNVAIYPEFSSSFLGITTIDTLTLSVEALRDAGIYFVATFDEDETQGVKDVEAESLGQDSTAVVGGSESAGSDKEPNFAFRLWKRLHPDEQEKLKESASTSRIKLAALSAAKAKLRAKLATCKTAQTECNFELAFAVLPPRDLKPVSDTNMKKLVANTIALIGACESKYALMGDGGDAGPAALAKKQLEREAEKADIQFPSAEDRGESSNEISGYEVTDEKKRRGRRGGARRKSLWRDLLEHTSDEEKHSTGDEEPHPEKKKRKKSKTMVEQEMDNLELVKPRKEIEFGDVELLVFLVNRISQPLKALQSKIDESVNAITLCLAYCYDVNKLPSGARAPAGITIEELDIRLDLMTNAIIDFDRDSAQALEGAAALHEANKPQLDIMPRMEVFLVSSFLLNLRQAALHTKEMLVHSRDLVDKRQARHGRRRLYAPRIKWRKWLTSGGEMDDFALPEQARKDAREGKRDNDTEPSSEDSTESVVKQRSDEESQPSPLTVAPPLTPTSNSHRSAKPSRAKITRLARVRSILANFLEYSASSEDILYAIKLTVAVFLVTWPAFIGSWNEWYYLNRGLWAALQLVLITEVAIGTSVMTFFLRAAGTSIGCLWGFAAYASRSGNPYTTVVLLVIGIIPSAYIQLGSKYVKAGMVSIISMCIVALATELQTVPGTATENFLKRFIAFLIGGIVALIVEVAILPVRARDRLVESLASAIRQISEMESCLAFGIESEINVDVHSKDVSARFDTAKAKAQGALTAAETFLPFCAQEPRLKGSFKSLALVYAEILYVLHQIVDKMDNMLQLRKEYGSGVLEELNTQVYSYRRNVAGSITLILFAVHEALTTKLPLPQFLPSARLAHLRMVNRVREVVMSNGGVLAKGIVPDAMHSGHSSSKRSQIELNLVKRIVRQKFLSWNAASAGQIEVIEYLEELIDLTKLLVGANEFRSGMLTRPTYRDYVQRIGHQPSDVSGQHECIRPTSSESNHSREREELRDTVPEHVPSRPPTRRLGTARNKSHAPDANPPPPKVAPMQRMSSAEQRNADKDNDLPMSLQRVRSRRIEQTLSREEQSWASGREGRRVRFEN